MQYMLHFFSYGIHVRIVGFFHCAPSTDRFPDMLF